MNTCGEQDKSELMRCFSFILIIFLMALVVFASGCCGSVGSDPLGSGSNTKTKSIEKVVAANNDGSLKMDSPSGLLNVEAAAETFKGEVNVTITENEVTEAMSNYFSSSSRYFTISAEKIQSSSIGGKQSTKVTAVDKPITIKIKNNIGKSGVYYLGTRANSNQEWKYTIFNEGNTVNNPITFSSRYSINNNTSDFYIKTFNVDFQFTIFIETFEHYNETHKSVITGFYAEVTPQEYETENDLYKDNLTIKATMAGDNISSLKASDYIVEIGFLNNDSSKYNNGKFPVTGADVTYDVSGPDEGAGDRYKHTITLKNISDFNNNVLSFGLGISKLSPQIFPANFTVTVKVNGKSDVVAFEDTKGITLKEKKSSPDVSFVTVSEITPANNASDVAVDTNVVIRFSDNVAWADDTKGLVTLSDGQIPIACNYVYTDKTLTLTPFAKLNYNKIYTVMVSKYLKPIKENAYIQESMVVNFTTETADGIPVITPDTSKSIDNRYYLVSDQKFTVDFNKAIENVEAARNSIYMQKDGVAFNDFTVDFDSTKQFATITIRIPLEAEKSYTAGVNEFTDNDNSVVKSANATVIAMSDITVTSIEIASGTEWLLASGSSGIAVSSKIKAVLSSAVEPEAVKLIQEDGTEVTAGISDKTSEKAAIIEFEYSGLNYDTAYGVAVSYTDAVTGQKIESTVHTFITEIPDEPVLLIAGQANSEDNPYLIYTARALDRIRDDEYRAKNYYFKQMADIDLATSTYISETNTERFGWEHLGTYSYPSDQDNFIGHYDGNNKKIQNLTINNPYGQYSSLFGYTKDSTINNLELENVWISANDYVAAIVGILDKGNISHCYSSGFVYSENSNYVGGIVSYGINYSRVENCHSSATVDGYGNVGGVVGKMDHGLVTNCYSTGQGKGGSHAGGVIGDSYVSNIMECYSTGQVKGRYPDYSNYIGGVIGSENTGSVFNCYSTAEVSDGYRYVGGVVGFAYKDDIDYCFAKNVKVTGQMYVGGLIGYCDQSYVEDCGASGEVNGDSQVGGLVGYIYSANVYDSTTSCNVTGTSQTGGLYGYDYCTSYSYAEATGLVNGNPITEENIIGYRDGF